MAPGSGHASAYDACLAAAASDPQAAFRLADGLEAEGNLRSAAHCRALTYVTTGNASEAAQEMVILAGSLDDPTASARFRLQAARLLAGAEGRTAEALDALAPVLENDATPSDIALEAALLATDLAWSDGDHAAAETALLRAEALAPGAASVLTRRSAMLREQGRAQDAVDLLATPEFDTPPADFLLERGLANVGTGRLPAARADWVRLIALYPGSPAAAAAQRNLDRLDDAMRDMDHGDPE